MADPDLTLNGLLLRISMGDAAAMTDFYETTRPAVVAAVRRTIHNAWDADEVVQDVYRQVWTGASQYRTERGSPVAWLLVIARCRSIDLIRRRKRSSADVELTDCCTPSCPDGKFEAVLRFEAGLIRRALRQLPEQQRRFLEMSFADGYSHGEIAAQTGIPLGTVKGRIRNALLRLRQIVERGSEGGGRQLKGIDGEGFAA